MDKSAVTIVIVCESLFAYRDEHLCESKLALDAAQILKDYQLDGIFIFGKDADKGVYFAVSKRDEVKGTDTTGSSNEDQENYVQMVEDAELRYETDSTFRSAYDSAAARLMECIKNDADLAAEFNQGLIIHAALLRGSGQVIPFPSR